MFESFDEFFKYASQYSVFDKEDLHKWFNKGGCKAIKMLYNAALPKRIVRHDLIESLGAFCGAQRPLMRLTSAAMRNITAA